MALKDFEFSFCIDGKPDRKKVPDDMVIRAYYDAKSHKLGDISEEIVSNIGYDFDKNITVYFRHSLTEKDALWYFGAIRKKP